MNTGSRGEANMTSRYLLESFKHVKYNIYIYHILYYDCNIYIYISLSIYIYLTSTWVMSQWGDSPAPPQLFGVPGGHEFLQLRCPRPRAPRRSGAWQRPTLGRTVIRGPVPEIGMDNTRHVKNWLWLFGVLGVVVLKLRRASQTMREKKSKTTWNKNQNWIKLAQMHGWASAPHVISSLHFAAFSPERQPFGEYGMHAAHMGNLCALGMDRYIVSTHTYLYLIICGGIQFYLFVISPVRNIALLLGQVY